MWERAVLRRSARRGPLLVEGTATGGRGKGPSTVGRPIKKRTYRSLTWSFSLFFSAILCSSRTWMGRYWRQFDTSFGTPAHLVIIGPGFLLFISQTHNVRLCTTTTYLSHHLPRYRPLNRRSNTTIITPRTIIRNSNWDPDQFHPYRPPHRTLFSHRNRNSKPHFHRKTSKKKTIVEKRWL